MVVRDANKKLQLIWEREMSFFASGIPRQIGLSLQRKSQEKKKIVLYGNVDGVNIP